MVSHDIFTLQGAGVSIANLISSLPEMAGVSLEVYIF